MKARLEEKYLDGRTSLQKDLGLANIMQIPRLSKIVINTGVKESVGNSKVLTQVKEIIDRIAGQSSVKTKARKSIAGFKLREGMAIGVSVTLRGHNMYNFLDKLINIALPCVRDFQGVSVKMDGSGNYNLGIRDWMIFPEVDYDMVDQARGMNISIHTTAQNDEHAKALLDSFNMPFKKS